MDADISKLVLTVIHLQAPLDSGFMYLSSCQDA